MDEHGARIAATAILGPPETGSGAAVTTDVFISVHCMRSRPQAADRQPVSPTASTSSSAVSGGQLCVGTADGQVIIAYGLP